MLRTKITNYKEYIMVGNVFVKNGLNLIYGASGLGKTFSTIKALNEDNITPYLIDFDNNLSPETTGLEFVHLDGVEILKLHKEDTEGIDIPDNGVFIVDTWQLFIDAGGTIDFLKEIAKLGNTVVIVAHNKDLATKQNIPDMDRRIANHMDSKLYLEYDKGSSTKTNPRPEGVNLHIEKLRNYAGDRIIPNWMRR